VDGLAELTDGLVEPKDGLVKCFRQGAAVPGGGGNRQENRRTRGQWGRGAVRRLQKFFRNFHAGNTGKISKTFAGGKYWLGKREPYFVIPLAAFLGRRGK
jgi:hypothetical protein